MQQADPWLKTRRLIYWSIRYVQPFLADRTNGRAYATVSRLSVVCRRLWRYVLWLNGAS